MLELLRVRLDLERGRIENTVNVLDVTAPHPKPDEIRPRFEAEIVEREIDVRLVARIHRDEAALHGRVGIDEPVAAGVVDRDPDVRAVDGCGAHDARLDAKTAARTHHFARASIAALG